MLLLLKKSIGESYDTGKVTDVAKNISFTSSENNATSVSRNIPEYRVKKHESKTQVTGASKKKAVDSENMYVHHF